MDSRGGGTNRGTGKSKRGSVLEMAFLGLEVAKEVDGGVERGEAISRWKRGKRRNSNSLVRQCMKSKSVMNRIWLRMFDSELCEI